MVKFLRWLLAILLLLGCRSRLEAQEQLSERQVEAAYIFNFAKFVQWPDSAFANRSAPLVIGICGDSPLGDELERLVDGKTAQDRKIEVKRSERLDDLKNCQIIFFGNSVREKIQSSLHDLKASSALTVSNAEGFLESGGMIHLYLDDNKVRFKINLGAAEDSGLSISSKLLKLAKAVEAKEGKQ